MNLFTGFFAGIWAILKGAFSFFTGLYGGSLTASFLLFSPLISLLIFLIPLLVFTVLFPEFFVNDLIDLAIEAVDFVFYGVSSVVIRVFPQIPLNTQKMLAAVTSITFGVYAFFIGTASTTVLGFGLGFIFMYTIGSIFKSFFNQNES